MAILFNMPARVTDANSKTLPGAKVYFYFTGTSTLSPVYVAVDDVIHVSQKSGTDKYIILVTKVQAGSFDITFATTGGTTTEQPVFSFAVVKAVNA